MLSIESGVPIREIPIFSSGDVSSFRAGEPATESAGRTAPVWRDDAIEALDQAERAENRGQLSRAERDFTLAASWAPDDPAVVGQLGQFYALRVRNWDKAWSIADKLIASHPQASPGWVLRAMVQKSEPRPGLRETDEYIIQHFSAHPEMEGNVEQSRWDLNPDRTQDPPSEIAPDKAQELYKREFPAILGSPDQPHSSKALHSHRRPHAPPPSPPPTHPSIPEASFAARLNPAPGNNRTRGRAKRGRSRYRIETIIHSAAPSCRPAEGS